MKQIVCVFEDGNYENFLPLTYLRPVYELKCGIFSLRRKIENSFKYSEFVLHMRHYLQNYAREEYGKAVNEFKSAADSIIFINGRIILSEELKKRILKSKNTVLLNNGSVVAANFTKDKFNPEVFANAETLSQEQFKDLAPVETDAEFINYPWDLVHKNKRELEADYRLLVSGKRSVIDIKKYPGVYFINKKNIFIEKGAVLKPFTVLDSSDGPIYISKDAQIMSHASIQGPSFIGQNTVVKMHAALYHGTSIGDFCKVGGEIESSIIHSYSNKQHGGFLGHSYLGSWVNIGAGSNNSDLKNNYGNVSVPVNRKPVDSGSMFVGLIMGDHSKTAINTNFNTGTVVGISSNIFGSGFPDKFIPSFFWGGSEINEIYSFDKAVNTAKIAMSRRDREFTEKDFELFRHVFNSTKDERIKN